MRVIWKQLHPSSRQDVVKELLPIENADLLNEVQNLLAKRLNFRRTTIGRLSQDAFALHLTRHIHTFGATGIQCLVELHLKSRSNLLQDLYEGLSIEHDGLDVSQSAAASPLNIDQASKAARDLIKRWPIEDVWLCFATMARGGYSAWRTAAASAEILLREEIDSDPSVSKPKSDFDVSRDEAISRDEQIDTVIPAELRTPRFTTLDEVMIRSLVSSLNQVEGSLSWERLDDLVQELVELNDQRYQSYFHRGFADALLKRKLGKRGPGENASRRAWHLVGFTLGKIRVEGQDRIHTVIKSFAPSDEKLLLDDGQEAPRMIASIAIEEAFKKADLDTARQWIDSHGFFVAPQIADIIIDYCQLFILEKYETHKICQLLEQIERILDQHKRQNELGPPRELTRRVLSLRATALRMEGHHDSSIAILDKILEEEMPPYEYSKLLTYKALATMGIRSVEQLGAEAKGERRDARLEELRRVEDLLKDALSVQAPSPIALYAASLPTILDPTNFKEQQARAEEYLRDAIAEMTRSKDQLWERSKLLTRARFYLTVMDLRRLDPGVAEIACDRLMAALEDDVIFPEDLVIEAIGNAVLLGAPGVDRVANKALNLYQHKVLHVLDLELLSERSEAFRVETAKLLLGQAASLSADEQLNAWESLLAGSLKASPRDIGAAEQAIDRLEGLAEWSGCEERFLEVLGNKNLWDPVWSKGERDIAQLKTLFALGRDQEALSILRDLAHSAISASDLESGEAYLEELELGGEDPNTLAALQSRFKSICSLSVQEELNPEINASVLWIGGNEIQARNEEKLRNELKTAYLMLRIEFIFSGWSSNWSKFVDRLRPKIGELDGIVISHFIRTYLGRSIRRLAGEHDIPWRACSGRGYASMKRAIEYTIRAV